MDGKEGSSQDWLESQLIEGNIHYDINTEKYFVWAESTITFQIEPLWLHEIDQKRLERMRNDDLLKVTHIGMTNKCTVRIK